MAPSADQELRLRIEACSRCGLAANCTGPVPFSGPFPAEIAIVGEAPGKTEDKRGEPFIGQSGSVLWAALEDRGFDIDEFFVCNTVSCFPHGSPPAAAVKACRRNLFDQLDLSEAHHVLLLGRYALDVFQPYTYISRVHGIPFTMKSRRSGQRRMFFPTWHPAFVLRDPSKAQEWLRDLDVFTKLVE